ncbi:MAG: hypothetical protein KF893_15315 [Caldilineaceae bacterium]|nr:hypothetical protein [Caldilineaceae bacterium]
MTLDFFILRSALYFVIWILLVYFVTRFSYNHDKTGDDTMLARAKQISIVGLLLIFVTTTLASLDWIISLNPKWYSTIYFGIPFALLLTPGFRTDVRRLVTVASLILGMRLLGMFWVILPVYSPGISFNWMNFVLPLAFGELWVALYIWSLKRHHLLPINHPEWIEVERREFSEAEIIT